MGLQLRPAVFNTFPPNEMSIGSKNSADSVRAEDGRHRLRERREQPQTHSLVQFQGKYYNSFLFELVKLNCLFFK